ncbi:MAG: hypothetical protein HY319_12625 [Armatimonadetes bacterium]|nr:hypothetical protein [Armatimonadota bacterium]
MSDLLSNVMGNAAQATGMPKSVRARPETERTEPVQPPAEEAEETRQKSHATPQAPAAGQGDPSRKRVRRRVADGTKAETGYRASKSEARPKPAEASDPRKPGPQQQTASPSAERALWRLGSQASLTRAVVRFEQSQQNTTRRNVEQSRNGTERMHLNNLVRMMEISTAQHTGGKAGEAFPRRETRHIYSALLGLKSSSPERREERRSVRHTDSELKFKEGQARGLMAILEPEPDPADYRPFVMVA